MDSLRELYRIGHGPSSSHTMGPRRAAEQFLAAWPGAARIRVHLYGSLSATGRGHLTDHVLGEVLAERAALEWHRESLPAHPNGMRFEALDTADRLLGEWTVYSVGGGALSEDGSQSDRATVYPEPDMQAILQRCRADQLNLPGYVRACEDAQIDQHLDAIWATMVAAVERGLATDGRLPGPLRLERRAPGIHRAATAGGDHERALICAYTLAVSEENAAGGCIATAPSCGACGVLPGLLYHLRIREGLDQAALRAALAAGGIVGNLVKHRASISGAEVGCQGEVGTACAMAAAAACQVLGGTIDQVECAAEMGLEHHLGLTCDPVLGLVQIPCIERNALASGRALDCAELALLGDGHHRVGFDACVNAMRQTGRDLLPAYRETATGGLAVQLMTSEDGGAPCA
jgi:L-serine dehydratase